MATQLFLRRSFTQGLAEVVTATDHATEVGTNPGWNAGWLLSLDRGTNVGGYTLCGTVAGPTAGIDYDGGGTEKYRWISQPLAEDVTISGSITFNIWGAESAMTANVGLHCIVEVLRANALGTRNDNTIDRIISSEHGTELPLTTRAVRNWSATPGAGVAVNKGDRLALRVLGNDAGGNMSAGATWHIAVDENTPGNDGDSYITFTETFTIQTADPAGTVLYFTDVASDVATASVDREIWTSRGAGVVNDVTNTAAGWTAPIHVTDTAGGTVVDWFTPQLAAFTLGSVGKVKANLRWGRSTTTGTVNGRLQIAVVDADGSNPVVWGDWAGPGWATNTETAYTFTCSGDELAVADGQRLRFRLYIDDNDSAAMTSGQTVTFYYAGTSGGASGDSFVTMSETLTEYAPGVAIPLPDPRRMRDPYQLAHR